MSGGHIRRAGFLRTLRTDSAAIVRLLILAFALQLAVPLFQWGNVSARAGEAGLQADLLSSLCHAPDTDDLPARGAAQDSSVKHCIFCMPMAGGHFAAGAQLQVPAPALMAAKPSVAPDNLTRFDSRSVLAWSRAPPAPPRSV